MSANPLPWHKIGWKEFEYLSLYLAESLIPGSNFSTYLKQGNFQSGIDVRSSLLPDDTYFTIQCKNVKKTKDFNIEKVVEEFLAHQFAISSSKFIICTTLDLKNEKSQNAIDALTEKLRQREKPISFECWDINFFTEKLRNEYSIVEKFFDVQTAEEYCLRRILRHGIPKRHPEPDFIARNIALVEGIDTGDFFKRYYEHRESLKLTAIFDQSRLDRKFVCLIGDAHQGKSILVRQTAFEIENIHVPYTSLLIELKSFNTIPIQEMLDISNGNWKQVAAKDLVVFIDGLDEVPTDKFIETAKNINNFATKYHNINVVFSCRKLFYTHYSISNLVSNCIIYELLPLTYHDVEDYVESKLKERASKFKQLAISSGISSLLYQPFYLNTLLQEFQKPPHTLPSSKASIIEKFIDNSYNGSSMRLISGGRQLHEKMSLYRIAAQKLAFGLQLAGLNAMDSEVVQVLFSDSEIELLQQNSLITKHAKQWSFSNAIFQEHLAAMLLSKLPYEEIIAHISIGKKLRKIKTKWIQTVSSLISLLDENKLKERLFGFVKKDNIELLFNTEPSKYTSDQRLTILEEFIDRCNRYHIRTILVYEEAIASFLKIDNRAIDYLLNIVGKQMVDVRVKIVALRILKELDFSGEQKRNTISLFAKQIKNFSDGLFARNFIEILTVNKLGSREAVRDLLSMGKMQSDYDYRDGIYRLIVSLGMVDDFYEYGIEGIKHLIEHNRLISHHGSEYSLEDFLISTSSPTNIAKLLVKMTQEEWLYFYQYGERKIKFIKKICDKAIKFYPEYPLIIFSVIAYIKALGRHYLQKEFQGIEDFFVKTGSHWLAVRILADDILQCREWELSGFITSESFDYLLFEFEEANVGTQTMWSCIHGLKYKGKNEIANSLLRILDDATGGLMSKPNMQVVSDKYEFADMVRQKNDLLYFRSIENFKTGIVLYFNAYGKKVIPENEIYVDEDHKAIRQKTNSTLVFNFLINWLKGRKMVFLKDALNIIGKPGNFEYFRAQECLNYSFKNLTDKNEILSLVELYYQNEIKCAKFENCIKVKLLNNGETQMEWQTKEYQLGELLVKFGFDTPVEILMDMVWLDAGGARSIETSRINNRKSISMIILERLSDLEVETFRQKILDNIAVGIMADGVLGNHIGLCSHLDIRQAKFAILEILKGKKKVHEFTVFIDTYIKLGGETKPLLLILKKVKSYHAYEYFHLVEKLINVHPTVVKKSLLEYFHDASIGFEDKVNAARHLCVLGEKEAFSFLANQVRLSKKSPYSIQGKLSVKRIDTKFALQTIDDLMYFLVTPEFNGAHFSEGAKNILLEWLNEFAAKSEDDLHLVYQFMLKKQRDLKNSYSDHYDLFWYAFHIVEKFRDADKNGKTIDEIKMILNKI